MFHHDSAHSQILPDPARLPSGGRVDARSSLRPPPRRLLRTASTRARSARRRRPPVNFRRPEAFRPDARSRQRPTTRSHNSSRPGRQSESLGLVGTHALYSRYRSGKMVDGQPTQGGARAHLPRSSMEHQLVAYCIFYINAHATWNVRAAVGNTDASSTRLLNVGCTTVDARDSRRSRPQAGSRNIGGDSGCVSTAPFQRRQSPTHAAVLTPFLLVAA